MACLGPASWQNPKKSRDARTRSRRPRRAAWTMPSVVAERRTQRETGDEIDPRACATQSKAPRARSRRSRPYWVFSALARAGRDERVGTTGASRRPGRHRRAFTRDTPEGDVSLMPRHRAILSESRRRRRAAPREGSPGAVFPARRRDAQRPSDGCAPDARARDATDGTTRAQRARMKFVSSVGSSRTMLLEVLCATCNRKEGYGAASSAILRRGESRPERSSDVFTIAGYGDHEKKQYHAAGNFPRKTTKPVFKMGVVVSLPRSGHTTTRRVASRGRKERPCPTRSNAVAMASAKPRRPRASGEAHDAGRSTHRRPRHRRRTKRGGPRRSLRGDAQQDDLPVRRHQGCRAADAEDAHRERSRQARVRLRVRAPEGDERPRARQVPERRGEDRPGPRPPRGGVHAARPDPRRRGGLLAPCVPRHRPARRPRRPARRGAR